jgi:rubrerythrin
MTVEMSGYEVLEIAEKIERNGMKFYRRAAGLCNDDTLSTLLVQLAQWEARHVEVFREMRKRLAAEHWKLGDIAPDRVDGADARGLAGLAVFGIQPDPAQELTGNEGRAEILQIAIEKEKDSIVYYTGLRDFVPKEADRKVVEEIIQEEMKHVRILVQSLEQVT